MSKMQQKAFQQQYQMQSRESQHSIRLEEGTTYFHILNSQAFGSTIPLVRQGGHIPSGFQNEFVVKGPRQVYVVSPTTQTIDLNTITPNMLTTMIEVSNPMAGTLLVSQEAISQQTNKQRTLLKG